MTRPGASADPRLDPSPDPARLAGALRAGSRADLARAITLIESTRPEHRQRAGALLALLAPHAGGAMRLGITGLPGAGKSTFIERLGGMLVAHGRRVAVLAVDPSSTITGGSILGDRTRMPTLSASPSAFIRPSPSGGALGGLTTTTRQAILLCEAAGYDVVIVETVGVGQSEAEVADLTDVLLVLLIAGAGDELQGMKRGVLERAELVAINKADGANVDAARLAAQQHAASLPPPAADRPRIDPPVVTCSALTGEGVAEIWTLLAKRVEDDRASGRLDRRRHEQLVRWLDQAIHAEILRQIQSSPVAQAARSEAIARLSPKGPLPTTLAEEIVRKMIGASLLPTDHA